MKTEYKAQAFIIQKCPMCGKEHTMPITEEQDRKLPLIGKKFIQKLFPELNPCEREFVKTGYCPKCQTMIFGNGETNLIHERTDGNE